MAERTKATEAWNGYADALEAELEKLTPDPEHAKMADELEQLARRTAAEITDPAMRAEVEARLEAGSDISARQEKYTDGLKAAVDDARRVASAYGESSLAGAEAYVDAKAAHGIFELGREYGDALKKEAKGGFLIEMHPSLDLIGAKTKIIEADTAVSKACSI